jgi:hypothetical protein
MKGVVGSALFVGGVNVKKHQPKGGEIMWNWLSGNLLAFLTKALQAVTPEIRELLKKLLDELEAKASQTPNRWDDVFVATLRSILGM